MDKAGYLKWVEERGEAGDWELEKCRAADALIKRETLAKLMVRLQKEIPNDTKLRAFVLDMARYKFGTVEVDQLMMHLGCYPEWMVVD